MQDQVPAQGYQAPPQVPNDPQMGDFTLEEFRASMILLDQSLIAQYIREVVDPTNPIGEMNAYRIIEFFIMNPLEFSGFKLEEDPNGFINKA